MKHVGVAPADDPCLPVENAQILRDVLAPRAEIRVTCFDDPFGTKKTELVVEWEHFEVLIREPSAKEKKRLPLLKLATFGDQRTTADCLRTKENMIAVTGIEGQPTALVS